MVAKTLRSHRPHQDLEVQIGGEIRRLDGDGRVARYTDNPDRRDGAGPRIIDDVVWVYHAPWDIAEPLLMAEDFAILLLLDDANSEI